MKKTSILLLLFVLSILPFSAAAQSEELDLKLNRNWGYGGLDGRIQGTFTLVAEGPESLVNVQFLINNEVVNVDNEPPFEYRFRTETYTPGIYRMTATGTLADGTQISGPEITRQFISGGDARDDVMRLILPLFIVIGGIALLGVLGPLLLGRKRTHRPGEYGLAGGAVCPRCRFPYSRHVLSPNLLLGKLERCPHCGKWALVPRATAPELDAAEARLAREDTRGDVKQPSEDERLERMIEESRYED